MTQVNWVMIETLDRLASLEYLVSIMAEIITQLTEESQVSGHQVRLLRDALSRVQNKG